jgi:hypothetical protein
MSERLYRIDMGDGAVRTLPSVTTIVRMLHSFGLERYKLRLVADLTRSAPMDWSTDRILTAALDEGGAAAKAGTRQHQLADMIHGGKGTVTPSEQAMIEVIARFFGGWQLEVLAAEMAVASLTEGWAGRLDRVVRLGMDVGEISAGTVVMLDIKSGKAVQGEVALQLVGYSLADTALTGSGTLLSREPLPDWWAEISPTWGLVAHLRLDGTASMVPVRLTHDDERLAPISMMRLARQVWEWDRHARDAALGEPLPTPMTVSEVASALGAIDVVDEMDHYRQGLWAYLEGVTRDAGAEQPEALERIAGRWPAGVASFRAVRKGVAPLPSLAEMALVEATIAEAMARHQVSFPSRERPLPPRGATLEEAPESIIAIDSPHPLDVERFRMHWEQTHKTLFPRRRIPAMPSISTRRSLIDQTQRLQDFLRDNTPQVLTSVTNVD